MRFKLVSLLILIMCTSHLKANSLIKNKYNKIKYSEYSEDSSMGYFKEYITNLIHSWNKIILSKKLSQAYFEYINQPKDTLIVKFGTFDQLNNYDWNKVLIKKPKNLTLSCHFPKTINQTIDLFSMHFP